MQLKKIAAWCAACLAAAGFGAEAPKIDNSALIPEIRPDSEVKLEALSPGATASPDWVKSLIIVEANVFTASDDKKFSGMGKTLDHLAEMGVNGLWITPVNEGNHYGNFGIHTLNPGLTGETEMAERWARVREFVDEAHRRNIRVFFDVVSWGVTRRYGGAPLYREKPEWFGKPVEKWHGWLWNWKNPELREWFTSRLVEMILMTGADGFRCDCAPFYAGYDPYGAARERLLAFGRKVIFIAESGSSRKGVFDFDQVAFCKDNNRKAPRKIGDVFLEKNIVDVIRTGDELIARDSELTPGEQRFYTYQLTSHDSEEFVAHGSPVAFGYQALFSPFIPLWYLGEEWNNPRKVSSGWSWSNPVDWELLAKDGNRSFFELVKKMIRIRRTHPEIFEYFPASLRREANICKVVTDRPGLLQPYARYRNGGAVLIVPNNGDSTAVIRISIPYAEAAIGGGDVTVTDLLADRPLASGRPESFTVELPAGALGVYGVSPGK
ncbi:MAG: hypothetical protein HPZ91_12490 [Lentisphaeria bacterium]|nr:hypothetical protein [Lentisphaeria bacterium]